MSIAFKCSCGRGLRANPEMAGKKTKCPGCGSILTIPAAGAAAPSPPPAAPRPAAAAPAPAAAAAAGGMVTCDCGTKIRTKPEWAGKLIKCPKCEAKIKVPAAAPAAVAAPRPVPKPAAPLPADEDAFPGDNFSDEPFAGGGDFSGPASFQDDSAEAGDDQPVRRTPAAPPPKKKSRALFFGLILLLLAGGGGFAAYAYYFSEPPVSTGPNPSLINRKDDDTDDPDDDPEMTDGKKKPADKKDVDDPKVDLPDDAPKDDPKIDPPKTVVNPRKVPLAPLPAVVGGPAFDYVSGKVLAFKSFRPQALLRTPLGQKILADMEKGKDGEMYKRVAGALDVSVADITHVVAIVSSVPDMSPKGDVPALVVIETEKPIKEAGLDEFVALKKLEKQMTPDGKAYYTFAFNAGPAKGAVALIAPNLAVIGKDTDVIAVVSGKKEPLDEKIAPLVKTAAAESHLVFIGFQVPKELADMAVQSAPVDIQVMAAPFAEARSGQVSIAAGDTVKALVTLHFDDADKAGKAKDGVSQALLLGGFAIGQMKKGAPPGMEKLVGLGEGAFKSIKPKVSGNSLEVPLEVAASFDEIAKLLEPGLDAVAGSAANMINANNLKQLALAMHAHHSIYNGLPAARAGKGGLSWRVTVLPFVEQDQLYKAFKIDEPWNSENNLKLLDSMPEVFKHPTRPAKPGHTYYRVVVGPQTIFGDGTQKSSFARIPDGTSNTLMIVEAETAVPWTKFDELVFNPKGPMPKLGENGKFTAAFADGSVRAAGQLPDDILAALITTNGAEVVDFDAISSPPGAPTSNRPKQKLNNAPPKFQQKLNQVPGDGTRRQLPGDRAIGILAFNRSETLAMHGRPFRTSQP